jgi:death-on-curing family protein
VRSEIRQHSSLVGKTETTGDSTTTDDREQLLEPANIPVLYEDIVAQSEVTSTGIHSSGSIESAIMYVTTGYFYEAPSTLYEMATHLMRLLVAEHPFVDGNKRTALNGAAACTSSTGTTSRTTTRRMVGLDVSGVKCH